MISPQQGNLDIFYHVYIDYKALLVAWMQFHVETGASSRSIIENYGGIGPIYHQRFTPG
jgi:hypothetical protein